MIYVIVGVLVLYLNSFQLTQGRDLVQILVEFRTILVLYVVFVE